MIIMVSLNGSPSRSDQEALATAGRRGGRQPPLGGRRRFPRAQHGQAPAGTLEAPAAARGLGAQSQGFPLQMLVTHLRRSRRGFRSPPPERRGRAGPRGGGREGGEGQRPASQGGPDRSVT